MTTSGINTKRSTLSEKRVKRHSFSADSLGDVSTYHPIIFKQYLRFNLRPKGYVDVGFCPGIQALASLLWIDHLDIILIHHVWSIHSEKGR